MVPEPVNPLTAAVLLAQSFDRNAVEYAIGGALAYSLWGIPRATIDIDVNVFTEPDELGRVFDALEALEIEVNRPQARAASEQRGMFVVHLGLFRVDIFTPSIAFCDEALRTRVQRAIDDATVWFLSAEAIAVFKFLFFRGKDIVDLERLLAVQRGRLDVAYVRRHLVEMMGEEDERVSRLDAMLAAATDEH